MKINSQQQRNAGRMIDALQALKKAQPALVVEEDEEAGALILRLSEDADESARAQWQYFLIAQWLPF